MFVCVLYMCYIVRVCVCYVCVIYVVGVCRLNCSLMLTGSIDNTLKVWRGTTDDLTDEPQHIRCTQTVLAHDRDINSIDISPNDKLAVTASRDKSAKVTFIF